MTEIDTAKLLSRIVSASRSVNWEAYFVAMDEMDVTGKAIDQEELMVALTNEGHFAAIPTSDVGTTIWQVSSTICPITLNSYLIHSELGMLGFPTQVAAKEFMGAYIAHRATQKVEEELRLDCINVKAKKIFDGNNIVSTGKQQKLKLA